MYTSTSTFRNIVSVVFFVLLWNQNFYGQECNSEIPIPFINSTFGNLEVESRTDGLCLPILGCSLSNVPNLIDSNLSNFASASTTGVGVGHTLRITDTDTDYPAGSYVGYRIATSDGLLTLEILKGITIRTFLNGNASESFSGNSLLCLSLLSNPGNYTVGFNTTKSYDAIEIRISSLVGVLNSTSVYYAVVREYCPGPELVCNTPTTMNLPLFPMSIEKARTGLSGVVTLGSIENADNLISASTIDFASINLVASVLGSARISVRDQLSVYPVGTYAGFDIESSSLLKANALDAIPKNFEKSFDLFSSGVVLLLILIILFLFC